MRTLTAIVIAVTLSASVAHAGSHTFVVYLPGMGGTADLAKESIQKFCRYLEAELKWKANDCVGLYLDDAKAVPEAIDKQKPGFGILPAGTYLDLACAKSGAPDPFATVGAAGMSRSVKYHVVAKSGATLESLKGKRLISNHLANPRLVSRVILGGKVDVEKYFQLTPSKSGKRPIAALAEGTTDAALLDDAQFTDMKGQEFGKSFAAVYTSEPMPAFPMVSFPSVVKPAERDAVKKALLGMCGSAAGAPVCKDLFIDRFESLEPDAFKSAVQKYCKP